MDSIQVSKQGLSPCDIAKLEECLKNNNGDHTKCLKEVEAFKTSCGKVDNTSAPAKQ